MGLVEGFLKEGYNVVATSGHANREFAASGSLVLLDGDIGKQQTAADAFEAGHYMVRAGHVSGEILDVDGPLRLADG